MMSCLRKDDTFSIRSDSAKLSNSAGVLVFSSARCIGSWPQTYMVVGGLDRVEAATARSHAVRNRWEMRMVGGRTRNHASPAFKEGPIQ